MLLSLQSFNPNPLLQITHNNDYNNSTTFILGTIYLPYARYLTYKISTAI